MTLDHNFETKMWRGAFFPSLITGMVTGLIVSIWRGKSGAIAALLAVLLVFIFFSVHLVVAKISKDVDPVLTMLFAMFSYFAKVIFLGVLLFLISKFTEPNTVDRTSFGICAILITLAWLIGEIRAYLKLRLGIQR
jgi:uncharacterized membrane protein (GlpM family)